jgi:chromosome segregation ATPase
VLLIITPNMRRLAMDTPKAQATRLRRDFDDLISKLIDSENTARSDYEREVPQLEQQICGKVETIERIQREIEADRNRIVRLRDALRAATEDRREVEAIFGRRSKSKVGLHKELGEQHSCSSVSYEPRRCLPVSATPEPSKHGTNKHSHQQRASRDRYGATSRRDC